MPAAKSPNPFEELKRALEEIDAQGVVDNDETEEDRRWMEALRNAVASDPTFGSLTDEEIDAIADSTSIVSLDPARLARLKERVKRGQGRAQAVTAHWSKASAGKLATAALFRQDGEANPEEQKAAREALDEVRRQLDEEDGPQS